ncbi:MAG: Carbamoyltransferase HypF [Chloroflexi bacterium]|nr:Carbamoyltransferase HypF [Chloroflexota bacterium]
MAPFPMCPTCAGEYEDPLDRRFHAQPVACPECGPHVWLEFSEQYSVNSGQCSVDSEQLTAGDVAIRKAQTLLGEGKIVAIKGLGGFHLACDAENDRAVALLRERKNRPAKPLALMFPTPESVGLHCHVNAQERETLTSRQRPIVLLSQRDSSTISPQIAPGQNTLGVMLPYTPLHYLLFAREDQFPAPNLPYRALVMTSGNWSGEPIVTQNEDAREHLSHIADAFLLHNREIHVHCDDAVTRVVRSQVTVDSGQSSVISDQSSVNSGQLTEMPIRRSRGYAPFPLRLSADFPSLLATGAELKNTFCLTKDNYAFLGQHIGDLKNYETLRTFEESIAHFERLFRVVPAAVVCDAHPNYLASVYARERAQRENLPLVEVQHHHAHIAACMAENDHPGREPVIGVAFDGTGYGDDGAIWGGEILLGDYDSYDRAYHLEYVPLPGGDRAIKEPWRMALSTLHALGLGWSANLSPVAHAQALEKENPAFPPLEILHRQLEEKVNTPLTSSMGRLFDAVSALVGVRQIIDYEAQAAIELEALVDPNEEESYSFPLQASGTIGLAAAFEAILTDLEQDTPIPVISARFHNGLAKMVLDVSQKVRAEQDINTVALSGGVWQNITLLERTVPLLRAAGFTVLTHQKVPPNDGGLALGQAVIGSANLR